MCRDYCQAMSTKRRQHETEKFFINEVADLKRWGNLDALDVSLLPRIIMNSVLKKVEKSQGP